MLILGAGLSGIGAACHLRRTFPRSSIAILEAREEIGGTWDLFRYPGIRSDSDMFTMGYSFRPWEDARGIADGPSILSYIRDTAAAYGVERLIRFSHRAISASWSSEQARWTVTVQRTDTGEEVKLTCSLPVHVHRLLPLRRGLHPAVRRQRGLRRPDRAPPALARGPRLPRASGSW